MRTHMNKMVDLPAFVQNSDGKLFVPDNHGGCRISVEDKFDWNTKPVPHILCDESEYEVSNNHLHAGGECVQKISEDESSLRRALDNEDMSFPLKDRGALPLPELSVLGFMDTILKSRNSVCSEDNSCRINDGLLGRERSVSNFEELKLERKNNALNNKSNESCDENHGMYGLNNDSISEFSSNLVNGNDSLLNGADQKSNLKDDVYNGIDNSVVIKGSLDSSLQNIPNGKHPLIRSRNCERNKIPDTAGPIQTEESICRRSSNVTFDDVTLPSTQTVRAKSESLDRRKTPTRGEKGSMLFYGQDSELCSSAQSEIGTSETVSKDDRKHMKSVKAEGGCTHLDLSKNAAPGVGNSDKIKSNTNKFREKMKDILDMQTLCEVKFQRFSVVQDVRGESKFKCSENETKRSACCEVDSLQKCVGNGSPRRSSCKTKNTLRYKSEDENSESDRNRSQRVDSDKSSVQNKSNMFESMKLEMEFNNLGHRTDTCRSVSGSSKGAERKTQRPALDNGGDMNYYSGYKLNRSKSDVVGSKTSNSGDISKPRDGTRHQSLTKRNAVNIDLLPQGIVADRRSMLLSLEAPLLLSVDQSPEDLSGISMSYDLWTVQNEETIPHNEGSQKEPQLSNCTCSGEETACSLGSKGSSKATCPPRRNLIKTGSDIDASRKPSSPVAGKEIFLEKRKLSVDNRSRSCNDISKGLRALEAKQRLLNDLRNDMNGHTENTRAARVEQSALANENNEKWYEKKGFLRKGVSASNLSVGNDLPRKGSSVNNLAGGKGLLGRGSSVNDLSAVKGFLRKGVSVSNLATRKDIVGESTSRPKSPPRGHHNIRKRARLRSGSVEYSSDRHLEGFTYAVTKSCGDYGDVDVDNLREYNSKENWFLKPKQGVRSSNMSFSKSDSVTCVSGQSYADVHERRFSGVNLHRTVSLPDGEFVGVSQSNLNHRGNGFHGLVYESMHNLLDNKSHGANKKGNKSSVHKRLSIPRRLSKPQLDLGKKLTSPAAQSGGSATGSNTSSPEVSPKRSVLGFFRSFSQMDNKEKPAMNETPHRPLKRSQTFTFSNRKPDFKNQSGPSTSSNEPWKATMEKLESHPVVGQKVSFFRKLANAQIDDISHAVDNVQHQIISVVKSIHESFDEEKEESTDGVKTTGDQKNETKANGDENRSEDLVQRLLEDAMEADGNKPDGFEDSDRSNFEYDKFGFTKTTLLDEEENRLVAKAMLLKKNSEDLTNIIEGSDQLMSLRVKWENYLASLGTRELRPCLDLKMHIRQGIPYELRERIWKAVINFRVGKMRQIAGPNYYIDILSSKGGLKGSNPAAKQIELDLLRTLPNNKHYQTLQGEGVPRLRRILQAYSYHNPLVGYCQGLNRLVAIALLFLNEEDAFWCLVCIVDFIMPQDYYSKTLKASQADQRVLKELISEKLPRIYAHLDSYDVDVSLFTFNWFLTVFVDNIPVETFLRIWDAFLYEGTKVLFRFAIAFFKYAEEEILALRDHMAIHKYLRVLGETMVDIKRLAQIAFHDLNPFPMKVIRTKRDNHLLQVKHELEELDAIREDFKSRAVPEDRQEFWSDDELED